VNVTETETKGAVKDGEELGVYRLRIGDWGSGMWLCILLTAFVFAVCGKDFFFLL